MLYSNKAETTNLTTTETAASTPEPGASAEEANLSELMRKIVQLTKVLVFMHTRIDGDAARCAARRLLCEEEVRRVATFAAAQVESQRQLAQQTARQREAAFATASAVHRREKDKCRQALDVFATSSGAWRTRARQKLAEASARRVRLIADHRQQMERLSLELDTARSRALHDERWLARQVAAEVAKEKQALQEELDAQSAALRTSHTEELEELKRRREASVAALKMAHAESRLAATQEAEADSQSAIAMQEEAFCAERGRLEEVVASAQEELAAARADAAAVKEATSLQQRRLDEMSTELQERKRRAHALSKEADAIHMRRLKAEGDARDLRRQKAALDRSLDTSSASGTLHTERAVAGLSEEVRTIQTQRETLSSELERQKLLIEERQAELADKVALVERLTKERAEERRRVDELQRALYRLEQRV
mmetsp:Transcript_29803/g.68646  ORF Transcript_29803/g.68646 Transcript_29803/m.68646 type:complete len:428 (-) Transcript_29803:79-1362(-)